MKQKLISTNKIEKMAGLAFKNCIRLHSDSILLFRNKSFPSAYYLSVISLEEFGKVFWLSDFLFHTYGNEMDRIGQEKWLESIFSHKRKQGIFAYEFMFELPKPFLELLQSDQIETNKQNSIYVGLGRKNKKINFEGKIITPFTVNRQKAAKQITILNDALLKMTLGTIKGTTRVDSDMVRKLMNKKLFQNLRSNWKIINLSTQKVIKELEKLEDEQ